MKADEITWVKSPDFGVMDQIFLPAIFTGLVTTLTHMGNTLFGPKRCCYSTVPRTEASFAR